MDMKGEDIVVVMIPFLAQGHLNQLLHLSRLLSPYNLPIYYACYSDKIKQVKNRVHGWDPLTSPNFHFQEFLKPPFDHELSILDEALALRDPVGAFLQEVARKTRRMVVIYDALMAYVVKDIVSIQHAEAYCFNPSSAFVVCSIFWEIALKKLHIPTFVGRFIGRLLLPKEYEFPNDPLPSRESSFMIEFLDFIGMQYRHNNFSSGNLYATCKAVEGPYLDVLAKFNRLLRRGNKQWAVGPVHPLVITNDHNNMIHRHKCLKWLDKQEPNSVILVSFGTTSSLSTEQIKELAIGLERSQQKFIWVVRDASLREDEQVQIPQGYEERVEGRGIVVKDWAPQLDILGHSATGGFLSHCGWNSILESISVGVPLATWPMLYDHPRIALLVTKVLKIGIVVKDWERRDELITSTTIEASLKKLMESQEGKEVRMRVIELSEKVRQSMMDGGDFSMEMDSFISHITRC